MPSTIADYNLNTGFGKNSKLRKIGHVFNESKIDHLKFYLMCLWENFEEHILN